MATSEKPISEALRVPPGPVYLTAYDPGVTPCFKGGKKDAKKALRVMGQELAALQEKLYAGGYTDGERRILLVLQGMDTSGKGGVVKHCVGVFDPGAVETTSFKAPTEEERAHDFLWRIRKQAPAAGHIGIFDRSHYEDVLVARVHGLAPEAEIEQRYEAINAFERELADEGTTILKCMLNISADTQRERLLARLDDPTKQWKYSPGDVDERKRWPEYQQAYQLALERCNTEAAPWYVVPSDHKWYRNWAVGALLLENLRAMHLTWPPVDYNPATERERLART